MAAKVPVVFLIALVVALSTKQGKHYVYEELVAEL